MRLIDAEALKELFNTECAQECDNCNYYENCIGNQYCGLIDRAPTIEERPKGKWICVRWMQYKCSECDYDDIGTATNYCPNCGADMRGDV